jgi:hypothetical protein
MIIGNILRSKAVSEFTWVLAIEEILPLQMSKDSSVLYDNVTSQLTNTLNKVELPPVRFKGNMD